MAQQSRREFLKKMGMAAAGLTVGGSVIAQNDKKKSTDHQLKVTDRGGGLKNKGYIKLEEGVGKENVDAVVSGITTALKHQVAINDVEGTYRSNKITRDDFKGILKKELDASKNDNSYIILTEMISSGESSLQKYELIKAEGNNLSWRDLANMPEQCDIGPVDKFVEIMMEKIKAGDMDKAALTKICLKSDNAREFIEKLGESLKKDIKNLDNKVK